MGNGNMKPLPKMVGPWEVVKDLGMVEIPSLNNVSGNPQAKRKLLIQCPRCGYEKEVYLGHILSRRKGLNSKTQCPNCITHSNCILNYTYTNMLNRCYEPKTKSYTSHGARGIKVCKAWRNDRFLFSEWALSHGWKKGLWLDRLDNDGDYTPKNCTWANPSESGYNKRVYKNNTTGHRGISKYTHHAGAKLRFKVIVLKEKLGYFDTLELAIKAKETYIKTYNIKY